MFLRFPGFGRAALLLLALLTSALTVSAQRRRAALPPVSRPHTIEDTVHAVRRLFNGQDAHSTTRLATGLGGLSGVAVGVLLPAPLGNPGLRRGVIGMGLVSSGLGATLALQRLLRFSPKHRDEVVAAYQQGEPLPRYVRRRLRPEHFKAGR